MALDSSLKILILFLKLTLENLWNKPHKPQ